VQFIQTSHAGKKHETTHPPLVRRRHPYIYGEQPKIKGLIKLNANQDP